MALGLLDWLAVRGKAAQPARMPVVFKLTDKATRGVLAPAPTRLQVGAQNATVIFETETAVRIVPGRLAHIVAVDPSADAFYLPPPGLTSLDPLPPLPTQWKLKSFAATKTTKLQLDPPLGLSRKDMVLEIAGSQYTVTKFENDLATIDPPLESDADATTPVTMVTAFRPFGRARNLQGHVLYIGDPELLNLEDVATIAVVGAQTLNDATWTYWGKVEGGESDEPGWQPIGEKVQQADALVLKKTKKGPLEPRKVGQTESRWIRASVPKADGCAPKLTTDALHLRVNKPPPDAADPKLQIFINSTPDTTTNFFPLGREPKMFDTLYVGSAEAFSKPGASVDLEFQLADMTFFALSALHTNGGLDFLAGLDRSGALHLFEVSPSGSIRRVRDPVRPETVAGVAEDDIPKIRPVMWEDDAVHVAVALGEEVWVWHEYLGHPDKGIWRTWGTPPEGLGAGKNVDGLAIFGNNADRKLVALRGNKLSARAVQGAAQWQSFAGAANALNFIVITTIRTDKPDTFSAGFAGIANNKFYWIEADGTVGDEPGDATPQVTPCAWQRVGSIDRRAAAVSLNGKTLRAWSSVSGEPAAAVDLDNGDSIEGTLLDARIEDSKFVVYAVAKAGADAVILTWLPFVTELEKLLFRTPADPGAGVPAGAATVHGDFLYVPGTQGQVLSVTFTGTRIPLSADRMKFVSAYITSPLTQPLDKDDTVAELDGARYQLGRVESGPTTFGQSEYYWLEKWVDVDAIPGQCELFRTSIAAAGGDRVASTKLKLAAGDSTTALGDVLLIIDGSGTPLVFSVETEDPPDAAGRRIVNVKYVPTGPGPATADLPADPDYWTGETVQGQLLPALHLDASNNDPALLGGPALLFPATVKPREQRAVPVAVDPPTNLPLTIVFSKAWEQLPSAGMISFAIDGVSAAWRMVIGDTTSNPALSWEYWNGGWVKLTLNADDTLNLKKSGKLSFKVPRDLKPTDWAGKSNHWIRSRLVGGDYGREQAIVTSISSGSTTTQTVERSVEGIRPPFAFSVAVRYSLDDPALPRFVVTEDSGGRRDQSDANRVQSAQLEIFTPLCATLAQLNGDDGAAGATPGPQDCECEDPGQATAQPAAAGAEAASDQPKQQRALYLGFDKDLFGEPVNVLLIVDEEQDYEDLAPLEAATLVGNRFQPLVVQDRTRALSESGVLSLAFPVRPTPKELFGKSLSWVRLKPSKTAEGKAWQPQLRGAYLNAVWARAAETMTRELLGSSEGMPKLRLQLARPPVLDGTLELRVREPLGEEELRALREGDPKRVLSDVPILPGHWVLWRQVPDTDDCGPTERVYMLHEETGMVRFGDGRRGAIPPIGRDSIVAFAYQRTEPPAPGAVDVPANSVPARAALGLVTALEGVEVVQSADQAAGGVPPEPPERVLRFGSSRLRHRGRAVTARDFEDLALERLVDVAQARCFMRRGGVRLVVVVRGAEPEPKAALRRELRRALLERSPSWLSAADALRIEGPKLRRLRVVLRLKVASLDYAGEVSSAAQQRIRALFDTSTGIGWPLGANPSSEDIASALLDLPHLQSVSDIELHEVATDGAEMPWRSAVRPDEFVMLAEDGVRMTFDPVAAGS